MRTEGGWLLLDYGNVISLPQPAEDIAALAALAQVPTGAFSERYWRHRIAYDLGQPSHRYWGDVLGRPLDPADPLVADLDRADAASWSHLDPDLVGLLDDLAGQGRGLALLSNAPHPLADLIDASGWARSLTHRFYSCRLGLAKPDPAVYRAVLAGLGVAPRDVTFLDDRPENVAAAASLGIDAIGCLESSSASVAALRWGSAVPRG
nr:HAD family phosphatase [Micromonospora sp. DSM 115978]